MKNESSQHRRHLPPKQATAMLGRFPNLTSEIWPVNVWRQLSSEHIGRRSKDTYLVLIMLYFPSCLCSQYTLKWDVTVFWAESETGNNSMLCLTSRLSTVTWVNICTAASYIQSAKCHFNTLVAAVHEWVETLLVCACVSSSSCPCGDSHGPKHARSVKPVWRHLDMVAHQQSSEFRRICRRGWQVTPKAAELAASCSKSLVKGLRPGSE